MELTILGSGSALAIPREDRCEQCRSRDRRDRRLPSALLIDRHVLIDAPRQIVALLRSVGVKSAAISNVVVSHRHQDAAGGLRYLEHTRHSPPPGIKLRRYRVPHGKGTSHGFLINPSTIRHAHGGERSRTTSLRAGVAYFPDYSDIKAALPALRQATLALLDGSGWDRTFPSHQPMLQVIPIIKKLKNLKAIYFTHNGHSHIPHRKLEQMVRQLGDQRFKVAYHGLKLNVY